MLIFVQTYSSYDLGCCPHGMLLSDSLISPDGSVTVPSAIAKHQRLIANGNLQSTMYTPLGCVHYIKAKLMLQHEWT